MSTTHSTDETTTERITTRLYDEHQRVIDRALRRGLEPNEAEVIRAALEAYGISYGLSSPPSVDPGRNLRCLNCHEVYPDLATYTARDDCPDHGQTWVDADPTVAEVDVP